MPLATGGALVAFVLANVSLLLAVVVLGVAAIATAKFGQRRLALSARIELASRARKGALAGVLGTAAYDAVRYALVSFVHMSVKPFHAIERFGELFIGHRAPTLLRYIVGSIYHVANGVGFTMAYSIVVSRVRIWSAVLWALILEAFMLLLYPRWLGVNAGGEFAVMSIGGHLAYGTTVGYTLIKLAGGRREFAE